MNILYLSQVSWGWIFQRPQIIELMLEENHECTVVNRKYIFGKKISKQNIMPKSMIDVWQLPKVKTFKFLSGINKWLYKRSVSNIVKKYDAIWICHPGLFYSIPKSFCGYILYDCMDNYVAMSSDSYKKEVFEQEQLLLKRANLAFASSKKLQEVVPNLGNSLLVRNGYRSNTELSPIKVPFEKDIYRIGYFGTVSSWFDFELLKNSLSENKDISYHIIGPVEDSVKRDYDERIVFEGIVEHKNLGSVVKDYDALIMPFVINDIILSVDPVKLYEYICSGKCIISVKYPEIERFEPFVNFYETKEDYLSLLEQLRKNGFKPKYNEDVRIAFLNENSWEKRYELINNAIQEMEHNGKL